jgi:hypothetical protein
MKRFDVKTCMMQENEGKYIEFKEHIDLVNKLVEIAKALRKHEDWTFGSGNDTDIITFYNKTRTIREEKIEDLKTILGDRFTDFFDVEPLKRNNSFKLSPDESKIVKEILV